MVVRFSHISKSSRCSGMGSMSNASTFGRLVGEEDWPVSIVNDSFFEPLRGVLTSSVFIASTPLRLTVWTSFSSRTAPFAFTFFGREENDIEVTRQKKFRTNKMPGLCAKGLVPIRKVVCNFPFNPDHPKSKNQNSIFFSN